MDIRELQYFVQVADLGNYSLAAEQLYISQPALSKVVQKLETELGYDLFYTDRRLQKLTPEGRELYRKSLRVIREFEEIGNLAKSASEQKIGLEGQIYLGFPPAGGSAYFCELIAGFTRRYPEIRISIKEESSYQIMADIDAGMLDVGCALEPVPEGKYESTFFARDASRLVVSSRHRLAGKRSVCLKDLEGEPFFLLGSDYVIFNSLRDACRVVRRRGILMQEAVPVGGAMAAVLAMDAAKIEEICGQTEGIVSIANYNCPGQIVITGEEQAVDAACAALKEAGAKRTVRLNVSGPFHSAMLQGAGEKLMDVLKDVELTAFDTPYITNVTADYVTSTEGIRDLLCRQVSSSVRWQQSVERMIADGVDTFIEMGPGKTLSGFMRKISRDVKMMNIETMADYEKAMSAL